MTKLAYVGRADLRVLSANDMKSFGVEDFKKTEFARHQTTEVTEEAAKVLLEHETFKGQFKEVEDEDEELRQAALFEEDGEYETDPTSPSGAQATSAGPTPKTSTRASTSTTGAAGGGKGSTSGSTRASRS